jgi:hypothetical protein
MGHRPSCVPVVSKIHKIHNSVGGELGFGFVLLPSMLASVPNLGVTTELITVQIR